MLLLSLAVLALTVLLLAGTIGKMLLSAVSIFGLYLLRNALVSVGSHFLKRTPQR